MKFIRSLDTLVPPGPESRARTVSVPEGSLTHCHRLPFREKGEAVTAGQTTLVEYVRRPVCPFGHTVELSFAKDYKYTRKGSLLPSLVSVELMFGKRDDTSNHVRLRTREDRAANTMCAPHKSHSGPLPREGNALVHGRWRDDSETTSGHFRARQQRAKELKNKGNNNQPINNKMLTLKCAENQAMKQKLERWHIIFKLYLFLSQLDDYLDKYSIKRSPEDNFVFSKKFFTQKQRTIFQMNCDTEMSACRILHMKCSRHRPLFMSHL
ncbi:hypothetical protein G5I_07775 [Acromyrmex echinatior]|uniref:Uncharacterized protein n=1 Tax=Acromyrmex echinatior TaxID=103372 RepID=F4WPQ0_ACREC|nr:hypothetical protein G5I_07775 [Acromyrmex echinatior]